MSLKIKNINAKFMFRYTQLLLGIRENPGQSRQISFKNKVRISIINEFYNRINPI